MSGAISVPSQIETARCAFLQNRAAVAVALFATVVLSLGVPVPARSREPLSILGYTRSVSFWMLLPDGWPPDTEAAKKFGAIFILVPKQYGFGNAPAVIVASAYTKTALVAAMTIDRDRYLKHAPDGQIADRNSIVAKSGGKFLVREFRSHLLGTDGQGYESVAYHQQGPDTIVITLSAYTKSQYRNALRTFIPFVHTYVASALKVTVDK